jgi:hypothetical protein
MVLRHKLVFVVNQILKVEGAAGINKATILNDRVHVLTRNTNGRVEKWNIVTGVRAADFGVVDYDQQVCWHKHTHTHVYIYIYVIYICISWYKYNCIGTRFYAAHPRYCLTGESSWRKSLSGAPWPAGAQSTSSSAGCPSTLTRLTSAELGFLRLFLVGGRFGPLFCL